MTDIQEREFVADQTDQNYPVDRRWIYGSGIGLLLILVVIVGAVLLPVVTVVPGTATANQAGVTAAAAERKAADDAAAAKKAADDAAALLADAARGTKTDMQRFLNDPANSISSLGTFTVSDVQLINVGQNRFEGIAFISLNGGPQKQIPVHVLDDGTNAQWSTDKGAFLPLLPDN